MSLGSVYTGIFARMKPGHRSRARTNRFKCGTESVAAAFTIAA